MSSSITLASLSTDWLDKMLPIYESGGGDEEAMRALGVTSKAFQTLYENELPFMEAVEHGRLCRKAWFLTWGRLNLNEKGANYQGWLMQMRNLFHWDSKEKPEMSQDEFNMKSDEEIARMFDNYIQAEIAKKAKLTK